MKTSTIVWIVVAVLIILGGGWYLYSRGAAMSSTNPSQTSTQTTTQNPPTTSNAPATSANTSSTPVLNISSNATLGSYLVAANGMTLYTYSPDTPGVSNCTGQCAANWPPYTVSAGTQFAAMAGASGALATITRADGTMQVTYNNRPVYFYIKDSKPGDTNGQGVGGIWFVVTP